MKFSELSKHSTNEELQDCNQLVRLLGEGHPVVFFADDPKPNADGITRQVLYLVQARVDLLSSRLSKIQARALGWSPLRLVRTILNFDPKVVGTFDEDEQSLYKLKAKWEGCIIRVQESLKKQGRNSPKTIRGEIKVVNGKPVYENTVLAQIDDEDEKDFFYDEYELVAQIDEFKDLPDLGSDQLNVEQEEEELVE